MTLGHIWWMWWYLKGTNSDWFSLNKIFCKVREIHYILNIAKIHIQDHLESPDLQVWKCLFQAVTLAFEVTFVMFPVYHPHTAS